MKIDKKRVSEPVQRGSSSLKRPKLHQTVPCDCAQRGRLCGGCHRVDVRMPGMESKTQNQILAPRRADTEIPCGLLGSASMHERPSAVINEA